MSYAFKMATGTLFSSKSLVLLLGFVLFFHVPPTAAFGAGNIASISKIEGINWRHGDIEDMLKTIAFIKGYKWTSMMIKRVYFGNWLRDYSQAVDVGTLKGVQSDTIRILVWVLSFLTFGYATEEFEVTEERLGTYRPEEHIDNPKDYADNIDARKYDPRLRPPVEPIELQIDPNTGMKNYIANDNLGIATSSGYVRHSFMRSIHFGRVFCHGAGNTRHQEPDLYEALRCLGQGLHCLEDFGAHTNYTELALREIGYHNVFTHTGSMTEMMVRGKRIFPLVTGTFGGVDFLMSVLGEAQDHFTQSEVEQMDIALKEAQAQEESVGSRDFFGGSDGGTSVMTGLLKQVPGAGSLVQQAEALQRASQIQEREVTAQPTFHYQERRTNSFQAPPGSVGGPPGPGIPGTDIDPIKVAAQIYPILEFRDKVVKLLAVTIEKIPGLEALVDKITETVTLFVLSLLAPFVRPIIMAVSKQLKAGSTSVIDASGKHQYEPWTDPHCTDPTHSLLSKDHFSNVLNPPAGQVAATILQYVAPRIIYAWENPSVPADEVLSDILRAFHHPALRDPNCQLHQQMFSVVEKWAISQQGKIDLNDILSSESVKAGRNAPDDDHDRPDFSYYGKILGMNQGTKDLNPHDGSAGAMLGAQFPGTETGYDTRAGRTPEPQGGYGIPPGPGYGYSGRPTSGFGYGSNFEQAEVQPGGAYGSGAWGETPGMNAPPPVRGYGSGAWGEG